MSLVDIIPRTMWWRKMLGQCGQVAQQARRMCHPRFPPAREMTYSKQQRR